MGAGRIPLPATMSAHATDLFAAHIETLPPGAPRDALKLVYEAALASMKAKPAAKAESASDSAALLAGTPATLAAEPAAEPSAEVAGPPAAADSAEEEIFAKAVRVITSSPPASQNMMCYKLAEVVLEEAMSRLQSGENRDRADAYEGLSKVRRACLVVTDTPRIRGRIFADSLPRHELGVDAALRIAGKLLSCGLVPAAEPAAAPVVVETAAAPRAARGSAPCRAAEFVAKADALVNKFVPELHPLVLARLVWRAGVCSAPPGQEEDSSAGNIEGANYFHLLAKTHAKVDPLLNLVAYAWMAQPRCADDFEAAAAAHEALAAKLFAATGAKPASAEAAGLLAAGAKPTSVKAAVEAAVLALLPLVRGKAIEATLHHLGYRACSSDFFTLDKLVAWAERPAVGKDAVIAFIAKNWGS